MLTEAPWFNKQKSGAFRGNKENSGVFWENLVFLEVKCLTRVELKKPSFHFLLCRTIARRRDQEEGEGEGEDAETMFKKPNEVRAHQRISGADRKKLRRSLRNRFLQASDADLDLILPPKVETRRKDEINNFSSSFFCIILLHV